MDNLQGYIVKSKAGRDKGNCFVVLKTENEFAYIADGKLRKADRPKKKKLKHLQKTLTVSDRIMKIINSGEEVTNSELRKALAEYLNE